MRAYSRIPEALLTLMAAALASGCHPPSVCGPAGAVSGQIVRAEASPGYRDQASKQPPDAPQVPYFACRSEASIATTVSLAADAARDPNSPRGDEPENVARNQNPSQPRGYSPGADPRLHAGSEFTGRRDEQGEYRVLGIGRGLDRDDCGKTALSACENAVNDYFLRNRAVRPLDVVCRLDENAEYCAATAK